MTILLDTLELPDLTWTDPFHDQRVTAVLRRRLNGAPTLFVRQISGARPITLQAPEDQPLTVAQARALLELSADINGAYSLSLHDQSFLVRFRWEDGNPVELQYLFDYADPTDDDPVIGTLKLITI